MIQDENIDKYLGILFGRSEPGDALHHMLFVTAARSGGKDDLMVSYVAIDCVPPADVDRFIAKAIRDATSRAVVAREVPWFVGLAVEAHNVVSDGNEETENLAMRLEADGKLREHPATVEVTVLYAACRDGRRWTGTHYLTGAQAGTVVGPTCLSGDIEPKESGLHRRLIRTAVGLA